MKVKIIDYGIIGKYELKRAHYNDAGIDVYALEDYKVEAHETKKIPLGFGIELPDGFMGLIMPRSGLSSKGIVTELSPIDSGYRGEIHCILSNISKNEYNVSKGDRIGQLVIIPICLIELTQELGENRDSKGFGSTGN